MRKIRVIIFCLLIVGLALTAQTKTVNFVQGESSITYTLIHPLHEIESTSKEFECKIEIDKEKKEIKSVSVLVDVATFNSGNSNRDSHAMEVIDAISFPEALFTSTKVYQNGDTVKTEGKLTFHGITKDIVIAAATTWSANKLEIQGHFEISLTAFNVSRPALLMIPVEDTLRFSLKGTFGL